jgi:hypothetical protein
MSTVVLVLLILLLFGGGGYLGPGVGYYGGFGLGSLLVVVLIVMLATGRL